MKKIVALFGYNNSRIDDVANIGKMAKELYNAELLLCKENITRIDRQVATYVLDMALPGEAKSQLKLIEDLCKSENGKIIAILPFSDKGVPAGARIASSLGLMNYPVAKVNACLNKQVFREYETMYTNLPNWYHLPFFEKISQKNQVIKCLRTHNDLFLKPSSEGNSRGCCVVNNNNIDSVWSEVEPYTREGLIVEENMKSLKEYSYDSVGNYEWITEKTTTTGKYRSEIQQIVPAMLNTSVSHRLKTAGNIIKDISGSLGACHHEMFLLASNRVGTVEPNARPAGMKIWNLAQLAFGINFFEVWLRWSAGEQLQDQNLQRKCFAGIRMIKANATGKITDIHWEQIKSIEDQDHIKEVRILADKDKVVTDTITNNADFVGYLIATHPDYECLQKILKGYSEQIANCVSIDTQYIE